MRRGDIGLTRPQKGHHLTVTTDHRIQRDKLAARRLARGWSPERVALAAGISVTQLRRRMRTFEKQKAPSGVARGWEV
jgi:AraC-like DNA-binding protein